MRADCERFSAAILCGGHGRRLGETDKAGLPFGDETLLERKLRQLEPWAEVLICGGTSFVRDIYADCGPLGGIHAALTACKTDLLFVVGCDLPFADGTVAEALFRHLESDDDVVVPVLPDGRMLFVCALFRKRSLLAVERQLERKCYRLRELCRVLRVRTVPIAGLGFPEERFLNINTPAEYALALDCLHHNRI